MQLKLSTKALIFHVSYNHHGILSLFLLIYNKYVFNVYIICDLMIGFELEKHSDMKKRNVGRGRDRDRERDGEREKERER